MFRETVSENPRVEVTEELEDCIGCMAARASITLVRSCQSFTEGGEGACVNCYCRPMWCMDCMAKWSVTCCWVNVFNPKLSFQVCLAPGPGQPGELAGVPVSLPDLQEQVLC